MREVYGVKVKGLTRGQIDELKEFGFNWSFFDPPGELSGRDYDQGMKKVFDFCVINKDAFEDLQDEDLKMTTKIFTGILIETYGSGAEEKNLPSSGSGGQTKKE